MNRCSLKPLLLLFVLALSGCSSTSTVHIFAKHLSEDELNKVQTTLKKNEYEVTVNHYDFPDSVKSSAIIYSPMHSDPE